MVSVNYIYPLTEEKYKGFLERTKQKPCEGGKISFIITEPDSLLDGYIVTFEIIKITISKTLFDKMSGKSLGEFTVSFNKNKFVHREEYIQCFNDFIKEVLEGKRPYQLMQQFDEEGNVGSINISV